MQISSGLFPRGPQHCLFEEAVPYRAKPVAMCQNPASVAPAQATTVTPDTSQMLEVEVTTYSAAVGVLECRTALCPALWMWTIISWLFILPFWRKTRHWGREVSRVCFTRSLKDLWSTSQNQLSHCTQNLPLCTVPQPQRKDNSVWGRNHI